MMIQYTPRLKHRSSEETRMDLSLPCAASQPPSMAANSLKCQKDEEWNQPQTQSSTPTHQREADWKEKGRPTAKGQETTGASNSSHSMQWQPEQESLSNENWDLTTTGGVRPKQDDKPQYERTQKSEGNLPPRRLATGQDIPLLVDCSPEDLDSHSGELVEGKTGHDVRKMAKHTWGVHKISGSKVCEVQMQPPYRTIDMKMEILRQTRIPCIAQTLLYKEALLDNADRVDILEQNPSVTLVLDFEKAFAHQSTEAKLASLQYLADAEDRDGNLSAELMAAPLSDNDWRVKSAAIRLMTGNVKEEETKKLIEILDKLLNDQDSNVRFLSMEALTHITEQKNRQDYLLRMLDDDSEGIRAYATRGLAQIGRHADEELINRIERKMEDTSFIIRCAAVYAMARMANPIDIRRLHKIQHLRQDHMPPVRRAAIEALAWLQAESEVDSQAQCEQGQKSEGGLVTWRLTTGQDILWLDTNEQPEIGDLGNVPDLVKTGGGYDVGNAVKHTWSVHKISGVKVCEIQLLPPYRTIDMKMAISRQTEIPCMVQILSYQEAPLDDADRVDTSEQNPIVTLVLDFEDVFAYRSTEAKLASLRYLAGAGDRGENFSVQLIAAPLSDDDWRVRSAAISLMAGNVKKEETPKLMEMLDKVLNDQDDMPPVRRAASEALMLLAAVQQGDGKSKATAVPAMDSSSVVPLHASSSGATYAAGGWESSNGSWSSRWKSNWKTEEWTEKGDDWSSWTAASWEGSDWQKANSGWKHISSNSWSQDDDAGGTNGH